MDTISLKHRNLIAFGIPMFLILSIVVFANSALFLLHPKNLSIGITFDLILFIPVVYYLFIRKSNIPNITIVPFFIAGIVIASFIIPNEFQYYLTQVKNWVLPIVETTVFILVIYKVRQLNAAYKKDVSQTLDFYTALKNAATQILPKKLSGAFATEIAVIYYGFFSWKKHELKSNEFSYHKDSGTIALLSVFMFLIPIEISVVHLMLEKWSPVAAWILSILSLYTAFQIFGIMRSMSKRPIAIAHDELKIRYGIFSESTISISNIEHVELSTQSIELNDTSKKLSPLRDFESHNVVIHLKNEETLFGLYGLKSTYKTIALYVDEKEKFESELTNALQQ